MVVELSLINIISDTIHAMLDIRFIRENAERVQEASKQKGYNVDVNKLLALDEDRRTLQQQVDELRTRRNENSAKMKGGKPEQVVINEGKQIYQRTLANQN